MKKSWKVLFLVAGTFVVILSFQNFSYVDSSGLTSTALITCPKILPAEVGTFTLVKNIVYTRKMSLIPNDIQRFDFSRPPDSSLRPLIIMVHGGGWRDGTKNGAMEEDAKYFVKQGFAVANFNYPLVENVNGVWVNQFPAPVQALRCGLRYLNKNAAAMGIDKARVVTYGGSAGGNLSSMLAYAWNDTSGLLDSPECEHRLQPMIPIKASISNSGVYALRAATAFDREGALHYLGDSACNPAIDPSVTVEDPECRLRRWDRAMYASPRRYIRSDSPMSFIIHSQDDPVVNYDQMKIVTNSLQSFGVDFQAVTLAQDKHVPDIFLYANLENRSVMCSMFKFLDRAVGPTKPF